MGTRYYLITSLTAWPRAHQCFIGITGYPTRTAAAGAAAPKAEVCSRSQYAERCFRFSTSGERRQTPSALLDPPPRLNAESHELVLCYTDVRDCTAWDAKTPREPALHEAGRKIAVIYERTAHRVRPPASLQRIVYLPVIGLFIGRIIKITDFVLRVPEVHIVGDERQVVLEAIRKIGVADKRPSEGNGVRPS